MPPHVPHYTYYTVEVFRLEDQFVYFWCPGVWKPPPNIEVSDPGYVNGSPFSAPDYYVPNLMSKSVGSLSKRQDSLEFSLNEPLIESYPGVRTPDPRGPQLLTVTFLLWLVDDQRSKRKITGRIFPTAPEPSIQETLILQSQKQYMYVTVMYMYSVWFNIQTQRNCFKEITHFSLDKVIDDDG